MTDKKLSERMRDDARGPDAPAPVKVAEAEGGLAIAYQGYLWCGYGKGWQAEFLFFRDDGAMDWVAGDPTKRWISEVRFPIYATPAPGEGKEPVFLNGKFVGTRAEVLARGALLPAAPVPVPAAEREEAAKWCESVASGATVIASGTMLSAENAARLRLAAAALRGK